MFDFRLPIEQSDAQKFYEHPNITYFYKELSGGKENFRIRVRATLAPEKNVFGLVFRVFVDIRRPVVRIRS